MSELVHQLGIDWRLFLSQAANFLILLVVLRVFAYKPVLKILKDRQAKIVEGLEKAKEADNRLAQANQMTKEKMKEAEAQAMQMLRATEEKGKKLEEKMLEAAKVKEAEMMEKAKLIVKSKEEDSRQLMRKEATELVKAAVKKTVELDPKMIDEALVKRALEEIKR